MTTVSVRQAAKDFTGTLRRVTAGHEAVVLKRGRRAAAIMMPPDVLEALEDIRESDKAMAEYEKDPSKAVTWNQVKREAWLA